MEVAQLIYHPPYGPFYGIMGAVTSIVFTAMGASYGTAVAGSGIAATAVMRPELIMKSMIPVVMAGIVAIYGLVVSILIAGSLNTSETYPLVKGYVQFWAGMSVGFCGLSAGYTIGVVGEAGVRNTALQPRLFIGMILVLIFGEVLGLYGLIVAIYMYTKDVQ
ncbi:V-type proton ATPase 16 kDa proteolipid subunit-like [Scaptodrosophila lebanonensis]|uniref:V-type proton ATPase proteolipid subunit n=1 Tax=Drosophila lebanonensis TaxID=7225 RepID=A0A6J2TPY9_DROLE|nr:V-type proton ATPase 16 kDa proteolipid subunit-like [Scaptodrosophila lebanonensis]